MDTKYKNEATILTLYTTYCINKTLHFWSFRNKIQSWRLASFYSILTATPRHGRQFLHCHTFWEYASVVAMNLEGRTIFQIRFKGGKLAMNFRTE